MSFLHYFLKILVIMNNENVLKKTLKIFNDRLNNNNLMKNDRPPAYYF